MFDILGYIIYFVLFIIALWGAYCVVMVWIRVKQKQFANEEQQGIFLDALEEPLSQGAYDEASEICSGDPRALCQLSQIAIDNRMLGYGKVKQLLTDRFSRDVLADLENRLSWVYTVIKSAPMVGLLGTVMGMMGAFQELSVPGAEGPDITEMAKNIQLALYTTACGLAIAIPLVLATAFVNIRIKMMEDLVGYGLNQFLEIFREALIRHPK